MKLSLGKTQSGEQLEFDYIPYETRGILVQGISNSRKTSLVEEISKQLLQGGIQQIIFDMGPEFGRLRKYQPDFLIIGKEGEIPASVETAYELGRQVGMRKDLNVIIQLPSIKSEEDQEIFIDKFLDGKMSLDDTKYWTPCIVIIDESQKFATGSKMTKCRDAIVNICERGRKYGVMPILITQGIKDLYKNARVQLTNRIIGYTMEPADRAVACELLMMEKSDSKVFINLNPGEFMTWGTSITKETKKFQAETTKYEHEEKFAVPTPTPKTVETAKKIMREINTEQVSEETRLRSELAHVTSRLVLLQSGDGLPKDLVAMKRSEYTRGWNESNAECQKIIKLFNERHSGIFSKLKPCKMTVINMRQEDGRTVMMPGEDFVV